MVYLSCEDWMSQLDEELINYDMRENLDGSGLRQSQLKSDLDNTDTTVSRSPTYTTGANYYAYDDDMDWDLDKFNNMYFVLPVSHLGSQTVTIGPYTYSGDYDTATGDIKNMWTNDETVLYYDRAAAQLTVNGEFRVLGNEGSLGATCTAVNITLVYQAYDASADGGLLAYDADNNWYKEIATLTNDTDTNDPFRTISIDLTPEYVTSSQADNNGLIKARVTMPATGGETPKINIEQWIVTAVFSVASGHSTRITINDTQQSNYEAFAYAQMHEFGVGYTDETTDINDAGAGDVQILPNPLSQNDAFYFGASATFEDIKITISQAGDYDGTLSWQYWDGSSWSNLSSVTDGTTGFEAAAGTYTVTWTLPTDWETTAVNGQTYYWVRVNMITAIPVIRTTPLVTQGWVRSGAGNRLKVNTDLSITGLGLWEGCEYSICQEIYKHIDSVETPGTLITAGDVLSSKTNGAGAIVCASTVEHTSGISARHYQEKTRLEILRDLADMDKAVFWITLGGTTLTWKSTFNDGAPTALTDASVLSWRMGEYDYSGMVNEYHVYGIRIGDEQIYFDTDDVSDPGSDSKSTYGATRSKVYSSGGLVNIPDAMSLGDSMVERDEDAQLFLRAEITGNTATAAHATTLKLGSEVSITSTYLGLTAEKYIVSNWAYDSTTHITTLRLHPRVSQLGLRGHDFTGEGMRNFTERTVEREGEAYHPDLTSHTVT
jgi:hypothetical protein